MARALGCLCIITLLIAPLSGCRAPRVHDPVPPIARQAVPLQYGYGGQTRTTFRVTDAEWETIRARFATVDSPRSERRAVADAVQQLERIAGEQTPVRHDRGRNQSNPHGNGMTDCLDESANTTTFLLLLRQDDLLRHHTVLERVFRAPHVLDTHYSAALQERDSGTIYVVDSWFHDHGVRPVVQRHEDWLRKAPLPDDVQVP